MTKVLTVDDSLDEQAFPLLCSARPPVAVKVADIADSAPGRLIAVTRYVDGDSGTHSNNSETTNCRVYLKGRGGLGGGAVTLNGGEVGGGGGGSGGLQTVVIPTDEDFDYSCAAVASTVTSQTTLTNSVGAGLPGTNGVSFPNSTIAIGGSGGPGDLATSAFTFSFSRGSPGQAGEADSVAFGSGAGGGDGGGVGRTTDGDGQDGENSGGGAGGLAGGSPGAESDGGLGGGSSIEVWEYS